MMIAPETKVFERASWRRVSRRAVLASGSGTAAAIALMRLSLDPGVADPRVEQRVEDVGKQSCRQVYKSNDQDAALHYRELLVLRRRIEALADAVVVEELLDHDETTDQVAHLGRDNRDRRKERVAQDMPADDGLRRQALQVSRGW